MVYQEYIKYDRILARRVGAALCDYVCYFIFCYIYFLIVSEKLENGVRMAKLFPYDILVYIGIWLIWFPLIESLLGSTLFKLLFKLKVIFQDGSRINFYGTFARHLLDLIDLFFFFGIIGIILAKVTNKHQRLGDMLAGTYVIMKEDNKNTFS